VIPTGGPPRTTDARPSTVPPHLVRRRAGWGVGDLPGFVAAALELAIRLLDRDQDRVATAVEAYLEGR
jgi:hypothetical protein